MLCEGLPRSYLIKQCKDDINKLSHIVQIPGTAQGAQLDFQTELESVVQDMVSLNDLQPKLKRSDVT